MRLTINYLIVLFLLIAVSCNQKQNANPDQITGKIQLTEMNNQPINLEAYKGKTVFINVWATWCKPCIEEMPSIQQAQTALAEKNIVFLLASDEERERIESFSAKRKLDLHFVQLKNLEELQIAALPVTYIINAKGELAFSESGYRKWDEPSNIELLTKIIDNHE